MGTLILVCLAMGFFAFVVAYEFLPKTWQCVIAALIAIIISAHALITDKITLFVIMFFSLLLLTIIKSFSRR